MTNTNQILLSFLCFLYFIVGSRVDCDAQRLPIKAARTVSFTTDEGTNMDVDISPDGKTLLFDLIGDLFTVPVSGGAATQITRGVALNVRPVWSPEGKRIAFISDYSGSWHVNVMDPATGSRTVIGPPDENLGHENNFWKLAWTPDANHIVASQYGFGEDSVYGLAGGKLSLGVNFSYFLRFSPDGHTMYGINKDSAFVYSYNMYTHQQTIIFRDAPDVHRNVILSPDAHWLCFYEKSDHKTSLVIENLANKKKRVLISNVVVTPYGDYDIDATRFCFSPDSKNVYIGYGGKIHCIDAATGTDKIIPFKATVKSDLGAFDYNTYKLSYGTEKIKYARHAHISPDGKQLLFSALNKIYVMDLPGGKAHILAEQGINQFQPAYSPDGKWIAYVSWKDTEGGHLWRVPKEGGKPEQLTTLPGLYQNPAWSPDGNSIAIAMQKIKGVRRVVSEGPSATADYNGLEIVLVKSKTEKIIADSITHLNNIYFSPDGSRINYLDVGYYGTKLVSRNLVNDSLQVIAESRGVFPYLDNTAALSLSPDGRYIVYSQAEDLFLQPVYSGQQPLALNLLSNPYNPFEVFYRLPFIRFAAGIDAYWEKDGKTISWNYGNHFFSINVDSVMAAAERVAFAQPAFWSYNKNEDNNCIRVDIKPAKAIELDVSFQTAYAQGVIALKNARIITMKDSAVIDHGTIVIRDGRIVSVGPTGKVTIPAGAKEYDVTGTTIMPGMIDLHLHMHGPKEILPQQFWKPQINLAYGVTTARDPSAEYADFGFEELLQAGQMIGPRLFTVGKAVIAPFGTARLDNLDDAQRVVGKRSLMGAIYIKNYIRSNEPRIRRQWLEIASQQAGLNITNEGWGVLDYLKMIKDGNTGIEHSPPSWGDVYKDITSLFSGSGIWFTPTLQVKEGATVGQGKVYFNYTYWHEPDAKLKRFYSYRNPDSKPGAVAAVESIEAIEASKPEENEQAMIVAGSNICAQIRKMGGRVTLGSHGNNQGIGPHNELWALQMGGLTNMEALQAATIMGAEALGLQKDIGSIEVGKIADLIILNKNPLDDIHNSREIRYVMRDGILYNADTMDELWPVYKKCPEWELR